MSAAVSKPRVRVRAGSAPVAPPLAAPGNPLRPRAGLNQSGPYGSMFAYDSSAVTTQDMAAWLPFIRSQDYEYNYYRDRVVARSRDLVRNDGWADTAINRILDGAIGAQFRLRATPDYRALALQNKAYDATWADEFRRGVEAEWRMWAHDIGCVCDTAGQLTIPAMWRLMMRHELVDGESLAILVWDPDFRARGARYGTSLQLIDPDRLSNPFEQVDTHALRGGVEIDDLGRPLGYHLRRAHQNDWYDAAESMIWDRIPAQTPWGRKIVVHNYDRVRVGQHRGIPLLQSVMGSFKMLNRYDNAELQAAVLQAVMGFYIESPYDQNDVQAALDDNGDGVRFYQGERLAFHEQHPVMMNGVKIPKLFPGEKLGTINATKPSSNFEPFEAANLRRLAGVTGLTSEQMSQDYSKANYSSIRAAMVEAQKTVMRRRSMFSAGVCAPIYDAWLEEAISDRLRDLLPRNPVAYKEARSAYARCNWLGPPRGWVDPVKERQGAVLGLDAGFSTLARECAEQGEDWEEIVEQRGIEVRKMRDENLPLPDWAGGAPADQTETRPQPV